MHIIPTRHGVITHTHNAHQPICTHTLPHNQPNNGRRRVCGLQRPQTPNKTVAVRTRRAHTCLHNVIVSFMPTLRISTHMLHMALGPCPRGPLKTSSRPEVSTFEQRVNHYAIVIASCRAPLTWPAGSVVRNQHVRARQFAHIVEWPSAIVVYAHTRTHMSMHPHRKSERSNMGALRPIIITHRRRSTQHVYICVCIIPHRRLLNPPYTEPNVYVPCTAQKKPERNP